MKQTFLMVLALASIIPTYGQFGWVKTLGGSDKDHVNGFVYDQAGHVYLTGHISDDADMDPHSGVYNLTYGSYSNDAEMFVAKYDSLGNIVWAINTPGIHSNSDGMAIAFDPMGYVYVLSDAGGGISSAGLVDWDPSGAVATVPHGQANDVVLIKYDTAGNFVWAKLVAAGSQVNYGNGLKVDQAGNIYVTGQYGGTINTDPNGTNNFTTVGGRDIYFSKFSSAGNLIWAHSIGGSGDDEGQGLEITAADKIVLFGHFQGANVDFDPSAGTTTMSSVGSYVSGFYAQYDGMANLEVARSMEGLSDFNDLKIDADGNVIGAGFFSGTIDLDPSANTVNITAGVTGSSYDHFLVKYDSTGALIFGHGFPSTAFALQEEGEVLVDAIGNIYFGGNFAGTVDYSGGLSTGVVTSAGPMDLVIAKYSPSGAMQYVYNFGTAVEQIREFELIGNDLFIVGDFRGNVNFDPCGGNSTINKNEYEVFMLKMDQDGCGTGTGIFESKLEQDGIEVYPNPNTSGWLHLVVEGAFDVRIYAMNGQLVEAYKDLNGFTTLDITALDKGVYSVEIIKAEGPVVKKVVVGF